MLTLWQIPLTRMQTSKSAMHQGVVNIERARWRERETLTGVFQRSDIARFVQAVASSHLAKVLPHPFVLIASYPRLEGQRLGNCQACITLLCIQL
jgi:hypothetical protein